MFVKIENKKKILKQKKFFINPFQLLIFPFSAFIFFQTYFLPNFLQMSFFTLNKVTKITQFNIKRKKKINENKNQF